MNKLFKVVSDIVTPLVGVLWTDKPPKRRTQDSSEQQTTEEKLHTSNLRKP